MSLKISGYASLFGVADLAGDEIIHGALAASLANRQQPVAMLYQHDATRPLGHWTQLRETTHGLWVEGVLAERVQLADEVSALIEQKMLRGLSIGFRPVRVTRGAAGADARVKRRLHQIELVEISIVTFPMQPLAALHRPVSEEHHATVSSLTLAGDRLRRMTQS